MKTEEHWSDQKQRYLAYDEEYDFYKYSEHVSPIFLLGIISIIMILTGIGIFILSILIKYL